MAPDLQSRFVPRLLFSHIPKNGGTSIHRWLAESTKLVRINSPARTEAALARRQLLDCVSVGHVNVDDLVRSGFISSEHADRALSISVTRNPFSRAYSLFSHYRSLNHIPATWTLDKFLELVIRSRPRNGLYNLARFSQASTQVSWLKQHNWSGPNFVVRLEEVHLLEEKISKYFLINVPLPRVRVSESVNLASVWNDRITQLVLDCYGEDFDYLGYDINFQPVEEK